MAIAKRTCSSAPFSTAVGRGAGLGLPLFALLLVGVQGTPAAEPLETNYKTYRDWDLVLPRESFARVSGDFRFPGISPATFKTELDGSALRIDKNGDGQMDAKVEGETGVVTFRGETKDGDRFRYSVRLRKTSAGWHYAASGAALASIDRQKVRFIDQNNNGRYDEYGTDAILIGQGRYASFLSKVINVRGNLYSIDVSRDGRRLSYEPYAGEHGTLDLTTRFATKGKLLSAIVRSEDGMMSFNVTGKPMAVPVGKYHLYHGSIGLGRNVVKFSKGKVGWITVATGEKRSVAFGEPVQIDFSYIEQPGRVIMAPQLVSYVGRAGEVYDQWTPFGGSPRFEVKDADTGKRIALAIFGGS